MYKGLFSKISSLPRLVSVVLDTSEFVSVVFPHVYCLVSTVLCLHNPCQPTRLVSLLVTGPRVHVCLKAPLTTIRKSLQYPWKNIITFTHK